MSDVIPELDETAKDKTGVVETPAVAVPEASLAAVPNRRASMLSSVKSPMGPVASEADLAASAVEEQPLPLPANDGHTAIVAAPVNRRASMMNMASGPMAPEGSNEQRQASVIDNDNLSVDARNTESLASKTLDSPPLQSAAPQDTSTPVAVGDPEIAVAVNAPSAPRDENGALTATPEMRERANGVYRDDSDVKQAESGEPLDSDTAAAIDAVGGIDADAGLAGKNPGKPSVSTDSGSEDNFVPPEPMDVFNQMLINGLMAMRTRRRTEINEQIAELELARSGLVAQGNAVMANKDMQDRAKMAARMAASQGGPGGGGGLLSGIGSGISAVGGAIGGVLGRALGGHPQRDIEDKLGDINSRIARFKTERKIEVDHRLGRTITAADTMYKAQRIMANKVENFNSAFSSTPDGQAYLGAIQNLADARGITTAQVRQAIHAGDPETKQLAEAGNALLRNPVIAQAVDDIESLSRAVRVNSERMTAGIESAGKAGIAIEDLEGGFTDALSGMQCMDSLLARPGGEPIDGLKERMKEISEKLVETILGLVARFKAVLGIGGSEPQPGV